MGFSMREALVVSGCADGTIKMILYPKGCYVESSMASPTCIEL